MRREIRWVAQEAGPVDAVIARAGGDARALEEGRVMIGRARARPGTRVQTGDVVTIRPPAPAAPAVTILAREGGVLAVDKPAGIPTIADHAGGAHALLALVAKAAGLPESTLHPTSRLDRGVSGVVLFAADARARDRLREERAAGRYERLYLALAASSPAPARGAWTGRIGRAADPRRRAVDGRDATGARTEYAVVATAPHATLLAVRPVTGRTHQIRVHAAHAGCPLLGDRDYGGPARLVLPTGKVLSLGRVGLHCARVDAGGLTATAPVPPELLAWWRDAGGDDAAWDRAREAFRNGEAVPQ